MKVKDLLIDRAKRFGDKPAIIFHDQAVSFQTLSEYVFKFANILSRIGVKKGDRVAIYLPNYPEYIYSYLSLFSLGAVVVPLDFMLTEEEIVNFSNHSDSHVLIAHVKKGVDFENIKKRCPGLRKVLFLENDDAQTLGTVECLHWQEILKENSNPPTVNIADSDSAAIFYTSGSTGHPKGVLLNYGHLDNPVQCIDHFLHPTDKDSYLCAGVPFSHVGGLDYMIFMVAFGSTLVLMERFNPIESLKNIEKYKATIFCIVPAMFVAILSMKECDKFDLSSLRYAVVFGAPSSPVLLKRFHDLCPNSVLLNGWGMTETAAPNTYSPPDISKISTIGQFGVNLEVKIVDDQGQNVAPGEKGELLLKGKAIMVGYYKEKELTAQAFTSDGWFKTGDIAICDKDGIYSIVGRKKDMIKVAGEIVFASEVEEVLHRHQQIQEIAVIGVPDKMRGEAVKAYVVLREKGSVSPEDLRYFAREHIAHFKIPQTFEFRDTLPKNRVGKIDKETLTKEALAASAE